MQKKSTLRLCVLTCMHALTPWSIFSKGNTCMQACFPLHACPMHDVAVGSYTARRSPASNIAPPSSPFSVSDSQVYFATGFGKVLEPSQNIFCVFMFYILVFHFSFLFKFSFLFLSLFLSLFIFYILPLHFWLFLAFLFSNSSTPFFHRILKMFNHVKKCSTIQKVFIEFNFLFIRLKKCS